MPKSRIYLGVPNTFRSDLASCKHVGKRDGAPCYSTWRRNDSLLRKLFGEVVGRYFSGQVVLCAGDLSQENVAPDIEASMTVSTNPDVLDSEPSGVLPCVDEAVTDF